jgi:hypothetical protein
MSDLSAEAEAVVAAAESLLQAATPRARTALENAVKALRDSQVQPFPDPPTDQVVIQRVDPTTGESTVTTPGDISWVRAQLARTPPDRPRRILTVTYTPLVETGP